MDDFTKLFWQLDGTTKTSEKIAALEKYFKNAEAADAAWAVFFLTGQRIRRLIGTKLLREWATEEAQISDWLFEDCYDRVGDLAETISLLLPSAEVDLTTPLHSLIQDKLLPMRELTVGEQRRWVLELWDQMSQPQIFVLGKLMTGAFRVGVSKQLVIRALSAYSGVESTVLAHRLSGSWNPSTKFFEQLINPESSETPASKPYPFFLANPLKDGPEKELKEPQNWCAEWKWDGIRAQVIRRADETFIWSRGEELVTEQFPEIADCASQLPNGTVIDGEIVGWCQGESRPLPFSQLQRRLGRKRLGKKLLTEVPVALLAFDLLEKDGTDCREHSLEQRQADLAKLLIGLSTETQEGQSLFPNPEPDSQEPAIRVAPPVSESPLMTWEAMANCRTRAKELRAEGLMLKRAGSIYQVGRPAGLWWKWKVDPFTIDAVLVYAQRGHGRRASLYTDYTFAVWKENELVPFAKAYSGLSDAEFRKVDAFIRKNTKEKFGPIRSVTPQLVFELAFENIQPSSRHKSGIAVRFPRISRWRHDKSAGEADRLETILSLASDE
ncbi:MAG: ATP-dependent DNA ligase [Planctomycetota bacterium]|nr:ATP-dependent DNA ligase [Planctomycetota bacterium]